MKAISSKSLSDAAKEYFQSPLKHAAVSRHQSLYHYQGSDLIRLKKTLETGLIWMSAPNNFNDPWDCKPWFDLGPLDSAEGRDLVIQQLSALDSWKEETIQEELRRNPVLLKHIVEEMSRESTIVFNREYRVYCLTPNENNLLMWSHYADNHKGLCLQFDVRCQQIGEAYKVHYQEQLPTSLVGAADDQETIKALLTKSDIWAYEEEYRLLARDYLRPLGDFPLTVGNYAKLDDTALIGIVIGCQNPHIDEILEMVVRYKPDITVRSALRLPHKYGIGYQTIHTP